MKTSCSANRPPARQDLFPGSGAAYGAIAVATNPMWVGEGTPVATSAVPAPALRPTSLVGEARDDVGAWIRPNPISGVGALVVRERPPSFLHVASRLAKRQHGVVTRRQLLDAGVPPGVIERRVRGGGLTAIHRGVYRMGPVASPLAHMMAASLACGSGAVVSHRSAAELWRMLRRRPSRGTVHVTVRSGHPRRPGIIVHRREGLPLEETTDHDGIPVTAPARTLLDLGLTVRLRTFEQALAEALALRHTTESEIAAMVKRYEGRPGTRRLARALGGGGPRLTRSEAEERFFELVRKARLPWPAVNSVVVGYEVDFHWPSHELAVEIDGFAFHSSRRAFERDRVRDAELAAAGLRVVRFTWRQLMNEPLAVVARLSGALGAARGSLSD